jgi:hypothetical protein
MHKEMGDMYCGIAVAITGLCSTETANINSADPGLLALVMLLRFHGLGADTALARQHAPS